jgi:hypothetical protein
VEVFEAIGIKTVQEKLKAEKVEKQKRNGEDFRLCSSDIRPTW